MTDTAHTPGPWTIESSVNSNYGCEVHSVAAKVKAKRVVCRLGGPDRNANARLIAAAPDLLSALQEVMFEWRNGYGLRCENQVRAAIGKATGASS